MEGCDRPGLPRLGATDPASLEALIAGERIERVIACQPPLDHGEITELLHCCRRLSVKVNIVPSMFETIGPSATVDNIGGITVLGVNQPVLSRTSRLMKRSVDLAGAAVLSLLSLPLLALAAIAIKLDSRGPVFFVQDRIGQDGRRLRIIKFRTMVADAEQRKDELRPLNETRGVFKMAEDPRITGVGRLLRRFSLDELPQLANVMRGEMSLVGPRPLVPDEDCQIEGHRRSRLDVKPGMTGQWQILGSDRVPLEEMVKIDYLYVTNWSLWGDVEIILRTVPHVLGRRGV